MSTLALYDADTFNADMMQLTLPQGGKSIRIGKNMKMGQTFSQG